MGECDNCHKPITLEENNGDKGLCSCEWCGWGGYFDKAGNVWDACPAK